MKFKGLTDDQSGQVTEAMELFGSALATAVQRNADPSFDPIGLARDFAGAFSTLTAHGLAGQPYRERSAQPQQIAAVLLGAARVSYPAWGEQSVPLVEPKTYAPLLHLFLDLSGKYVGTLDRADHDRSFLRLRTSESGSSVLEYTKPR